MTYHALMDHEPDKFSAEAAKSNKRVSGGVHPFTDKLHLFGVGLRSE